MIGIIQQEKYFNDGLAEGTIVAYFLLSGRFCRRAIGALAELEWLWGNNKRLRNLAEVCN